MGGFSVVGFNIMEFCDWSKNSVPANFSMIPFTYESDSYTSFQEILNLFWSFQEMKLCYITISKKTPVLVTKIHKVIKVIFVLLWFFDKNTWISTTEIRSACLKVRSINASNICSKVHNAEMQSWFWENFFKSWKVLSRSNTIIHCVLMWFGRQSVNLVH